MNTVHPGPSTWSFNPLHCGAVVASVVEAARAPATDVAFQSPSLRGSGRFSFPLHERADLGVAFQSPSLRGSGRFAFPNATLSTLLGSFNPLHCGAVVASTVGGGGGGSAAVSIPFIAGQWSLQGPCPSPGREGSVSIPFIAGQWSLQGPCPSPGREGSVSIPFIAGQWSLPSPDPDWIGRGPVSIPFIAGQWSLQSRGKGLAGSSGAFQSPSLRGSGRFALEAGRRRRARLVSIPFIAGQWSLRSRSWSPPPRSFQSPSLRGSGRFPEPTRNPCAASVSFQSPSLRGSGRFETHAHRDQRRF